MPDLKMLNSTKYLYKLTFIKCSYGAPFFFITDNVYLFNIYTRRRNIKLPHRRSGKTDDRNVTSNLNMSSERHTQMMAYCNVDVAFCQKCRKKYIKSSLPTHYSRLKLLTLRP